MPVKPRQRQRSAAALPRPKGPASARDKPQGIRPSEVARAKKLVADPNYPPEKVLQAVARLLAQKLKS